MQGASAGVRRSARAAVIALVVVPVLTLSAAGTRAAEAPANGAAWLPPWAMTEAVAEVRTHSDLFAEVSPFWYDATSCSQVSGRNGAEDPAVMSELRAEGLRIQPTVTATGISPRGAIRCFGDEADRAAHVGLLVDLAVTRGYDGIDLDYEHLALTTDPAVARRVRAAFSRLAQDLCATLAALGKRCSVTVMPRTSTRFTVWRGKLMPAVYDYAALGAVADEVRVMAYDQHALSYGPGPIAGLPWVRRVVDYATATMPRARVRLGVPTYGRDFAGGSSVSLVGDAATELAARRGVAPRWDREQGEATFTYRRAGVRHTVWFSSPRAVALRTRLAARRGLAGAVYWAAGLAHSGTWAAVRGG